MARNNMTFTTSLRLNSASFKKGVKDVQKSLASLRNSFVSLAGALGVGLGFTKLVSSLKDTAVSLNVAKSVLENVSTETKTYTDGVNKMDVAISNYNENLTYTRRLAKDYSQDLVSIIENFAQFHAACQKTNLDLEQQRNVFESLTKAAAYYHLSADRAKDMMTAITQMMSKGKVASEELRRQLGNVLPGSFNLMAAALGVSNAQLEDMMKKGQVLAADALPRFAAMLDTVTKNANFDSLQLQMNALKNTWYDLVERSGAEKMFASAVNSSNNLLKVVTNNFNAIISAVKGLVTAILSFKLFKSMKQRSDAYFEGVIKDLGVLEKQYKKTLDELVANRHGANTPNVWQLKGGGFATTSRHQEDIQTVIKYNDILLQTERLKREIGQTPMMTNEDFTKLAKYNEELKTMQGTSVTLGTKLKGVFRTLEGAAKSIVQQLGGMLASMGSMAVFSALIGVFTAIVSNVKKIREEWKEINNIVNDYEKSVHEVNTNVEAQNNILRSNLAIMQDESKSDVVRLKALKEINKQLGLTGENAFTTDALDKTKQAYQDIVKEVNRWIDATVLQAKIQIQASKAAEAEARIEAEKAKKQEAEGRKAAMIRAGWYDQQGRHHEGIDPASYGDAAEVRKLNREIQMADAAITNLQTVSNKANQALKDLGVSLYELYDGPSGGGGGGDTSEIGKVFEKYEKDVKELENKLHEHAVTQEEFNEEFNELVTKYFEAAAATGSYSIDAILAKVDKGQVLTKMEKWYKDLYDAAKKASMEQLAKLASDAIDKSLDDAIDAMTKAMDDEMEKYLDKVVEAGEKAAEAMMEKAPNKKRDKTFDYKASASDVLTDEHKLAEERVQWLDEQIKKYKDLAKYNTYLANLVRQWTEELKVATKEAGNFEQAMKIAKVKEDIQSLKSELNNLAYSGIKDMASSMDRVVKGVMSLKDVLDDTDSSGWDVFITILNTALQITDTIIGVVKMVEEMSKVSSTLEGANLALINLENEAYKKQIDLLAVINELKGQGISETMQQKIADLLASKAAKTAASSNAKQAVAGATASGAKLAFPYNLLAIAAGVGAVMAALAAMSKYANGGIVNYGTQSGDNTLARVNQGEMILNKHQQSTLFNAIKSGNLGGGNVQFKIRGTDLIGVMDNERSRRRG